VSDAPIKQLVNHDGFGHVLKAVHPRSSGADAALDVTPASPLTNGLTGDTGQQAGLIREVSAARGKLRHLSHGAMMMPESLRMYPL